jgi:hypothetical protein
MRTEGPTPQGLQDPAQGFNPDFNPGNPHNDRRPERARDAARDEFRTYCLVKVRARNCHLLQWTAGPHFRLVRTVDLTPLQGASH